MRVPQIRIWQKAPALRLLVAVATAILIQWYAPLPFVAIVSLIAVFACSSIIFRLLPLRFRFAWAPVQGLLLNGFIISTAMLAVYQNDVRNHKDWFGRLYHGNEAVLVTLQEPLVEKPASYKALATVEKIATHDSSHNVSGQVILYFKKDAAAGLHYGSQVWVFEKVVPVKNSGNPFAFDYTRYSLFNGITHQAYITKTKFILAKTTNSKWHKTAIYALRQKVITVLKTYIRGTKEAGLAEALLIGYKDDLDKTLVQSYSNTGVVHIIAISGLHVGLIYTLLLLLTKPLRGKGFRWLRFALVLCGLWGFGLLAGAQPSVMRSVVMFTAIAAGVVLERDPSIYNNLALSALLLLCYNPFWLWDVGFQLSYVAVFSILLFFKPIYNLLFVQNKALDFIWKSIAVTLAAQVFTTPISLYYFHQFPLLFIITNLVAVPLSSLILIGEIVLCAVSFLHPVADGVGWLTTMFIRLMNGFIERLEQVSFSVWQGLYISATQTFLLLAFLIAVALWLLQKQRAGLWAALCLLVLFSFARTFSISHAHNQQQLTVYNIPKHQAIDIFDGAKTIFIGDVLPNDPLVKYHLQPARVANRITTVTNSFAKAFSFCNQTVLRLDTTINAATFSNAHADLLILSKNPKIYLNKLLPALHVKQVVIDASVPAWKARLWQRDCDSLRVPCYNVAQKGAFVMPLPQPTFAAL